MAFGRVENFLVTLIVLLSTAKVYSQDDNFLRNVRKSLDNKKKEQALRTNDENKLGGILYHLLRSSEEADTSVEKRAKLNELLNGNKDLHADSQGRVMLILVLRSEQDTASVALLVRSLAGEIEQVGWVPFIRCRVYPKSLRSLISNGLILRIQQAAEGRHGGIREF
jgi:hypothetical protein